MIEGSGPYYRPIESQRDRLPAWVLMLAGVVFAVAVVYFVTNLAPLDQGASGGGGGLPGPSAATGEPGEPVDEGAVMALIETAQCQLCHGDDLGGQGSFPGLHGVADGPVSENLQELGESHPDDWAQLWIAGDAPEVEGLDRGGMPVFAGTLTPEEIDLIVRYLKTL